MGTVNLLLTALCIGLITFGQIAFKKAVAVPFVISGIRDTINIVLNLWFLSGFAAYLICFVLYLIVLRSVPLTQFYVFFALTFITVPLASYFFLGDKLTVLMLSGGVLIVSGIILVTRGYG